MMNIYPVAAIIIIAIFSLCIGSMLNVVIYRLPLMMKTSWTQECRIFLNLDRENQPPKTPSFNLFFPASHCPSCQSKIPVWCNIPIISFLLLRGKSHCCHQKISWQYPVVELITLCLALLSVWVFGLNIQFVCSLLFIYLLVPIIFIDIEHQLIPDSLSLGLLWSGLLINTMMVFTTLPNAVISAACAYLSLWLVMQIYYLITGKIGMGHGDFKLFAAFGAWFGWTQLPLILLLSSITGSIIGIIYLKLSNASRNTPIPFGPFLCLGGIISLFWGTNILYWYVGMYQ